ncbi:PQQ-binding-like beta-propeller repeat protein [Dictyobacter formicarum]|uniref:Pyrrolo-quinoline quinone repeat domain-containing protein n=1 Tax=Dictyobacter formicarum TaxID=2778368 RepID=A0ABQ3VPG3_9CHLR|nr:PQQ-binding-like beta-propeller repeat protein [Dictyobacter formicarum]GHO88142.1 hypothetical protein KSZ_61480 [Dictyobacter formicarum]GHO88262.1 hypothetical protein KSZ_62680 [Dictyobacter formicarum]
MFQNLKVDSSRGTVFSSVGLFLLLFLLTDCGPGTPAPNRPHGSQPLPPSAYVLSSAGDLTAYQTNGAMLWRQTGQAENATESDLPPVGTHLIVAKQALYAATNVLSAYTRSGQVIWHQTLSAVALNMALGHLLYVAEEGGSVTAWNPTTGQLVWQQTGLLPVGDVVLAQDAHHLFVGGGNRLTAFDAQTGTVRWSYDGDPGEHMQQMDLHGSSLLLSTDGSLTDLDAQSGRQRWQQDTQTQARYVDGRTGTLYTIYIDVFLPAGGQAAASSGLRATDLQSGNVLWQHPYPIQVGESGTISPAGFLWASQTRLTSWTLQGRQRWQQPYQGAPVVQVQALGTSSFLVSTRDGVLTDLDVQAGHQRWQQAVGSRTSVTDIRVHSSLIWVISTDALHVLTPAGDKQWALETLPASAAVALA